MSEINTETGGANGTSATGSVPVTWNEKKEEDDSLELQGENSAEMPKVKKMTEKKTATSKKAGRPKKEAQAKPATASKASPPTTGQSRDPFDMPWDKLNAYEQKVVKSLTTSNKRKTMKFKTIKEICMKTMLTNLQVRNALRRTVPGGWIERGEPGSYRWTGKKKMKAKKTVPRKNTPKAD